MPVLWLGKKVSARVERETRKRVLESALLVEGIIKLSMTRGGRTESGQTESISYIARSGKTRSRKVEKGTGKRLAKVGTFSSAPGEVPRVQTGTLRRSITHEMNSILPIARVGTNVKYAKPLELGTSKIEPRPFLRPGLHKAEPGIAIIFARPMKDLVK